MPVTPVAKVAFRCKSCGRLHEAEHAGDSEHPHACRVCGAGVIFRHNEIANQIINHLKAGKIEEAIVLTTELTKCDPASKRLIPDNWEVLADLPPEHLERLGLGHENVERHQPTKRENRHIPDHLFVAAEDESATRDKAGQ